MHPEIREFPNRYFYQSRLRDAKKVLQRPVPMFVRKMTAALEDGEVRDDSSQWLGRCDTQLPLTHSAATHGVDGRLAVDIGSLMWHTGRHAQRKEELHWATRPRQML